MKLLRIKVSGWRCFADSVEVGTFTAGLNVIHAPNGTGKSTLFGALRHAFFDGHRTSGKEIQSLRPWGRELAPMVTIHFEVAGTEYLLEKKFLDSAFAKLSRKEGSRFVALSEADKADAELRAIFQAGIPGRGSAFTRPDLWGTAQVLWVPQGNLNLQALSKNLSAQVQESLGAQISGESGSDLETAIEDRYLEIFTPTGQYRSGQQAGAYKIKEKELIDLAARKSVLIPEVEEFESASNRVKDLQQERDRAAADELELDKRLESLRQSEKQYLQVKNDVDKHQNAEELTRQKYDDQRKKRDELAACKTEISKLLEEQSKQDNRAKLLNLELKRALEHVDLVNMRDSEVRQKQQKLVPLRSAVEDARIFTESQKIESALQGKLDRLKVIDNELEKLRKDLTELLAPTTPQLNKIEKAEREISELQTKLDASLISVQFIPNQAIDIIAKVADNTGSHHVNAEDTFTVKGSPEVVVEIAGFGQIRSSGPIVSVDETREALAKAHSTFEKLIRPFGTSNLEELRIRNDTAQTIGKKIDRLETKRESELDSNSIEVINQELIKAQALLRKIITVHEDWDSSPPNHEQMGSHLKQLTKQVDMEVEQVAKERDTASQAKDAAEKEVSQHRENHDRIRTQLAILSNSVKGIESDGLDDSKREEALGKLSLDWSAAKAQLAQSSKQLETFEGDPCEEIARENRKLESLKNRAKQCIADVNIAEGKLQRIAQAGSYSKLIDVEEAIVAVSQELEGEKLRSEGIKLLRDTVLAERQRVVASVAGPVENLATDMIRRIGGGRLGRIKLNEDLSPSQIRPGMLNTDDADVELDELSGGESEQVQLAVRLALAEVLTKTGNQLVILDDILVATDAGRLNRIQSILEEYATRLQILILTCHPERYRGFADCQYLDLEALISVGH